jgi:hypothetical protein
MPEFTLPEIEIRSCGVELRAAEGEGSTIRGYAAVFNSKSEDLGFREIILPGAFDRALKEAHDVRALWNHNSDLVLARTKNGTLRLAVDARGLKIEADLPDTQAGRDGLTLIKRGDVDQMSFAFQVPLGGDDWTQEGRDMVRRVADLDLLDVSPVAYAAYSKTRVSARALAMAKELPPEVPPPAAPTGRSLALNELRMRLWEF